MAGKYVATSTITIDAPTDRVWAVLTDPDAIKEFMFGTDVENTLTWTLEGGGSSTELTLSQDNNASAEGAQHSKGMWDHLVKAVKVIAGRD